LAAPRTTGLAHTTASLSTLHFGAYTATVGTRALFAGDLAVPDDSADLYDASTGAWSSAQLSQARWLMGAAVVGDRALLAGGATATFIGVPSGPSAAVDLYDATTGQWSTAALSAARWSPAATSAGGRALFAGGTTSASTASAAADLYDPATNQWSTATLSEARTFVAAASVGRIAVFAGGVGGTLNGAAHYSDAVDIYNARNGKWTTAHLSQARAGVTAAVVGATILFAGGAKADGTASDVVDLFDVATGTWSTAHLSQARNSLAAATVNGRVVLAGGTTSASAPSTAVDIYDAATGTWSTATLSRAATNLAVATVGDRALFAGGDVAAANSDAVDVYDGQSGTWSLTHLARARRLVGAATVAGQALFAGGDTGDTDSATSLVDVFTADATRPTAGASDVPPLVVNRQLYTFSVTYHDEFGIDATSLDDADIIVTGPGGFSAPAHMAFQARGRRSTTRFVVYTVQGPGRRWDASDNGTYTLHLQDDQVLDPAGNPTPGRPLGAFTIAIPTPALAPRSATFQTTHPINDLLK
jgi:hypothetical protein